MLDLSMVLENNYYDCNARQTAPYITLSLPERCKPVPHTPVRVARNGRMKLSYLKEMHLQTDENKQICMHKLRF